jgi:hypothetical protein
MSRDRRSLLLALGAVGALLALMVIAAAMGSTNPAIGDTIPTRLSVAIYLLATAGFAPGAYVLGSLGLSRVVRPLLLRGEPDGAVGGQDTSLALDFWALQLACGLGIMLSLSHLLGAVGLLDPSRSIGRMIAIAPIGLGLVLLAHQISKGDRQASATLPWTALIGLPGVAVLLVAACSPPGWLWDSEFGGYDALSYHLQLPQEWLAMGRVWPVEHNVYSYLPGSVESAFMHMEVASSYVMRGPLRGMIADGGTGLISAQLLHAGLTLCAGVIIGTLTRRLALTSGLDRRMSTTAGGLAASITLLTPWSVVVGSLAYNEMAVVALGAGSLLVASQTQVRPLVRGALCGALVGCACGAKPTAIFMLAPAAGVLLLGMGERREWAPLIGGGAVFGALMLAPWLIRNGLASGNPVFPAMSGVFGSGHWSEEQVARFAQKHSFDGSLFERIGLMFFADASDPAGARHRGLMHGQWSTVFIGAPLALAAGIGLLARRWTFCLLFAGLVLQIGAWLFLTHIQSRFLVPVLVTVAPLLAIGAVAAWARRGAESFEAGADTGPDTRPDTGAERMIWVVARRVVAVAIGLPLVAAPLMTFAAQRDGNPNQLLVLGPAYLTGEIAFGTSDQEAAGFLQNAPPTAWLNIGLPTSEEVLMIGESAPLYYRQPFAYATTWDTNPLARVTEANPESAWTGALRAEGFDFVLIDYNMLGRFHASGEGDPRLDPERIADWLDRETELIRPWPETGRALYRLRPPARSAPTPPAPDGGAP